MTTEDLREKLARAHFDAWRANNPGTLAWETFGESHKQRFYDIADVSLEALSSPPADDVREALANVIADGEGHPSFPRPKNFPPLDGDYRAADAILAAFEVRPRRPVTEQGAWVCAKCGGSALDHSLTTSTCVWEPKWCGPVTDAEVEDIPGFEGTIDALESLTTRGGESS